VGRLVADLRDFGYRNSPSDCSFTDSGSFAAANHSDPTFTGEASVTESNDPTFADSKTPYSGYAVASGTHRTVNGERILSVKLTKEDLNPVAERDRRQDRTTMRLNGANIGEWIGRKLTTPRIFKICTRTVEGSGPEGNTSIAYPGDGPRYVP